MTDILSSDSEHLSIFSLKFEIDNNLPKWKKIYSLNEEEPESNITLNNLVIRGNIKISDTNGNKLEEGKSVNIKDISDMPVDDFNILVSKRIIKYTIESASLTRFINALEQPSNLNTVDFTYKPNAKSEHKSKWFGKTFEIVKDFFKKKEEEIKEDFVKVNALDFFNDVKLKTRESSEKYEERLVPYLYAMKQAQDMGQQALVDKLFNNMITAKYESILYANGYYRKISEKQVVNFVKKTEKGVQLCYISNFARPIPKDVYDEKIKADDLLVFDNYCVLYYDVENKSYKMTEEEKKQEYLKKTDPILFGMIAGSTDLYYIDDWIDDKCNLTLDEFVKVSKLSEEDIKIDDKIKI